MGNDRFIYVKSWLLVESAKLMFGLNVTHFCDVCNRMKHLERLSINFIAPLVSSDS